MYQWKRPASDKGRLCAANSSEVSNHARLSSFVHLKGKTHFGVVCFLFLEFFKHVCVGFFKYNTLKYCDINHTLF